MTGMFKAHRSGYFYGKRSLTSKEIVVFSKEKDLLDWIKESWKRLQISAVQAHNLLGKEYDKLFKTIDTEIVELDPDWDAIKNRTKREVKKQRFNPYRDFNINYKGEKF